MKRVDFFIVSFFFIKYLWGLKSEKSLFKFLLCSNYCVRGGLTYCCSCLLDKAGDAVAAKWKGAFEQPILLVIRCGRRLCALIMSKDAGWVFVDG